MRASLDMRANVAARGPTNSQIATKYGFARTKSGYVRPNRCSYSASFTASGGLRFDAQKDRLLCFERDDWLDEAGTAGWYVSRCKRDEDEKT